MLIFHDVLTARYRKIVAVARRRSNSIPWCTSFRPYVTSSFIPRSRDQIMACFHNCLNSVTPAFKSTDLVYNHYVSKENFAVTVKGFTCVSLICREVQMSCAENICERRRALIPADELFAGVRSPLLIRISSSCDITVNSQDSVIFSGLLTEKSDIRSCFYVLTMRHRGGVRFVVKQ